jgi:cytoskeletal protein RodZ
MPLRMSLTLAVLVASFAVSGIAWPQQPQQAPQQNLAPSTTPPSTPVPAAPSEPSNPGLIEELGKVLTNSASGLKDAASGLTSKLPSAQGTLDGLNATTKDATDSLSKITPSLPSLPSAQSVASGRVICPDAANGAPDCKVASDRLCKEKGYKEGRSVDIETAKKCSVQAYLNGGGACRTENFVTRAVCQ